MALIGSVSRARRWGHRCRHRADAARAPPHRARTPSSSGAASPRRRSAGPADLQASQPSPAAAGQQLRARRDGARRDVRRRRRDRGRARAVRDGCDRASGPRPNAAVAQGCARRPRRPRAGRRRRPSRPPTTTSWRDPGRAGEGRREALSVWPPRPACSRCGPATTSTTSSRTCSRRRARACSSRSRRDAAGRHEAAARAPVHVHESPSKYRPERPARADEQALRADVAELQAYGGACGSASRTRRRPRPSASTPSRRSASSAARCASSSSARGLDLRESARLLGVHVDVATADTMIACWEAKYHYMFWRPNHAIQRADTDGNPATIAARSGLVAARHRQPPGVPVGPRLLHRRRDESLHRVLRERRSVPLVVIEHRTEPARPRTYEKLEDLVADVENARVWGGLHYRTTMTETAKHFPRIARTWASSTSSRARSTQGPARSDRRHRGTARSIGRKRAGRVDGRPPSLGEVRRAAVSRRGVPAAVGAPTRRARPGIAPGPRPRSWRAMSVAIRYVRTTFLPGRRDVLPRLRGALGRRRRGRSSEHGLGSRAVPAIDATRSVDAEPEPREWREPDLNRRHHGFQPCALPTELPRRGREV